ncbi:MAG: SCO family protein [Gammaproteobacteria bacterium]|nr:SCO family protein [Gammaproteobacteria bacterium]MDH4253176.1 SCO family protein [Gammaproteobacteria bacterium]MDH5308462.1 SCO family protein [Gammaproteobacteria bacterium]
MKLKSQCLAWLAVALTALSGHAAADEIERARDYFTNLELINQDGETVRFFDDVLKDKVVVINFIFTNCEGACPLMTHKLTLVRDSFEGKIGNPLQFVSLSIDPERDTPAAMKEFAKTHRADHDGWVFLTGKPENLETIIKRLGQFTDDVEAHSTMMLAGNVNAAHWIKIQPYEQPPQITEKIRLLLGDG